MALQFPDVSSNLHDTAFERIPGWVKTKYDPTKTSMLGPFRVYRIEQNDCVPDSFAASEGEIEFWWEWAADLITKVAIEPDSKIVSVVSVPSSWWSRYIWDLVRSLQNDRENDHARSRISLVKVRHLCLSGLLIEDNDGDSGYFHMLFNKAGEPTKLEDISFSEFFERAKVSEEYI
jgi:hypothetical protein